MWYWPGYASLIANVVTKKNIKKPFVQNFSTLLTVQAVNCYMQAGKKNTYFAHLGKTRRRFYWFFLLNLLITTVFRGQRDFAV